AVPSPDGEPTTGFTVGICKKEPDCVEESSCDNAPSRENSRLLYCHLCPHTATLSTITQKVCTDSVLGYSGGHSADISDIPPVDRVVNTGMAQKRCLCGQVANVDAASQMPGWKVRREVSIQCNLLPLLPPPLI
ncbi:hypothetical protein MTO96_037688, partial [Rhipicephalus appendiculatus]